MKVAVVNGPNIDILGKREPKVYGTTTLAEIESWLQETAQSLGVELQFFQSNWEGAIIDYLHGLEGTVQGLIINPAAFSHYSVAVRDALAALSIPVVEVHLSNIYAREGFRHHSITSEVVTAQISGLGYRGYLLALEGLLALEETAARTE
ncbi:MAG TPA: type II 3-dehydroquinate dehydratase [Chloroflexota bacterium]|nr:type II 3-dehydroquinate dehydratase [Chloroflexota bacterium]